MTERLGTGEGQARPILIWLVLALAVLLPVAADAAATYYAAPMAMGAAGTACTQTSRCTVKTCLTKLAPGDVCELQGGASMYAPNLYQGEADMIAPPAGRKGVHGMPLTVRCDEDGGCLLNGQFARVPIYLANDNDWWVIEGVTAKNGTLYGVVYVHASSDDNEFHRIVAWDATIDLNNAVIGVHSDRVLLEDVAAFGTARKVLDNSQGGDAVTCRRCWIRWDGGITGGSSAATMVYNSTRATFENSLISWSGAAMPQTYTAPGPAPAPTGTFTNFEPAGQSIGVLGLDRIDANAIPKHANVHVRGSIIYIKADARLPTTASQPYFSLMRSSGTSSMTFTDVVTVIQPGHPRFNTVQGFHFDRSPHHGPLSDPQCGNASTPGYPCRVLNNVATRLTTIRGAQGDFFHADWDVDNVSAGTSLAAVQSPWQNTAVNGARLCYRWGQTIPLWPWPMNERIKAATGMAGAYAGPCPGCTGGRAVRVATDVTADLERLLGPIPAACRTGASPGFGPTTPSNVRLR